GCAGGGRPGPHRRRSARLFLRPGGRALGALPGCAEAAGESGGKCSDMLLPAFLSSHPATRKGGMLMLRHARAGRMADLPKEKSATTNAGKVISAAGMSIIFMNFSDSILTAGPSVGPRIL